MGFDIETFLHAASVWEIPVLLANTPHEAAHGWAARMLGDLTAKALVGHLQSPETRQSLRYGHPFSNSRVHRCSVSLRMGETGFR